MGLLGDVREMHDRWPSPWLVAWSRVMTIRSVRVQRYLNMTPAQRRLAYPWLYENRVRKRRRNDAVG
jgi:hypothetical protein